MFCIRVEEVKNVEYPSGKEQEEESDCDDGQIWFDEDSVPARMESPRMMMAGEELSVNEGVATRGADAELEPSATHISETITGGATNWAGGVDTREPTARDEGPPTAGASGSMTGGADTMVGGWVSHAEVEINPKACASGFPPEVAANDECFDPCVSRDSICEKGSTVTQNLGIGKLPDTESVSNGTHFEIFPSGTCGVFDGREGGAIPTVFGPKPGADADLTLKKSISLRVDGAPIPDGPAVTHMPASAPTSPSCEGPHDGDRSLSYIQEGKDFRGTKKRGNEKVQRSMFTPKVWNGFIGGMASDEERMETVGRKKKTNRDRRGKWQPKGSKEAMGAEGWNFGKSLGLSCSVLDEVVRAEGGSNGGGCREMGARGVGVP